MGTMYKSNTRRGGKSRKGRKLATVKQVKALISRSVDKVWVANTIAGGAIPIAGLVTALSTGASGFGQNEQIHSYNIRFRITNVTNVNNTVRVIIFQWKDSTTPVLTDVLESAIPNQVYQDNLRSGMVHMLSDSTHQFNLYDKSALSFNKTFYKKKLLPVKTDGTDYWNYLWMLTVSLVDTNTTLSSVYTGHILTAQ